MTYTFPPAKELLAISSLWISATCAHANEAIVYHDYFFDAPGLHLVDSDAIEIQFTSATRDSNPLSDMCDLQYRSKTSGNVADKHPVFLIASERFEIPSDCKIYYDGVADLLLGNTRPDGSIYKFEIGYSGFLVYSRSQNKFLSEGASINWVGKLGGPSASELLYDLSCMNSCDPNVNKRSYFDIESNTLNFSEMTNDQIVAKIISALEGNNEDFFAMPFGYARYGVSPKDYSLIDVGNTGMPPDLSDLIPIYLWVLDYALLSSNYNRYFAYLFAKKSPNTFSCHNDDLSCLANLYENSAVEVWWQTPINH
jgi:hypothetical protein